ncbi:MAG: hypothetical protein QOJ20_1838 [Mycobacterium sp.]|nr:hypothetical protein [Mycobacterium sp.]
MRGSASRGIKQGFTSFTRPVFPSPASPGWNWRRFGFPLSFAPRRYRQRTSRAGTGHRARTWNYSLTSLILQSGSSLVSCDFASHRAKQGSRRRDRDAPDEGRPGIGQLGQRRRISPSAVAPGVVTRCAQCRSWPSAGSETCSSCVARAGVGVGVSLSSISIWKRAFTAPAAARCWLGDGRLKWPIGLNAARVNALLRGYRPENRPVLDSAGWRV